MRCGATAVALLLSCVVVHAVTLCPGVEVDNSGATPVGDAINICLRNAAAGQPVHIPAGNYSINMTIDPGVNGILSGPLKGDKPCGLGSRDCPWLIAHNQLNGPMIRTSHNMSLLSIILVARGFERHDLMRQCSTPAGARNGVTADINGDHCHIRGNLFLETACGAALYITGSYHVISGNTFQNSGQYTNTSAGTGADCIRLGPGNKNEVSHNTMYECTRVGISVGAGIQTVVANNTLYNGGLGVAGIMAGELGADFMATDIRGNYITGPFMIGIQIGATPWVGFAPKPPNGLNVYGNVIDGPSYNVNIEEAFLISLYSNKYGKTFGPLFACATRGNSQLNIDWPSNQIDRRGEVTPNPSHLNNRGCMPPLSVIG